LSEETKDSAERLGKRCVWIVDPLDGTREYSSDRHDWAVHVGLAVDGAPVLGAVALPAVDRLLAGVCIDGTIRAQVTGQGGGWPLGLAGAHGEETQRELRLAVSRSHPPDWLQRFSSGLSTALNKPTVLVPSGSVGFKVAMLAFGQADVYVHKKGLSEWDTCAPEAVARACGFAVCRADGSAQRYNRPNPRTDEIVVCRPWLRERVLEQLAAAVPP
jgi:3'(2'), 5'-bisphosphate nucleotidase